MNIDEQEIMPEKDVTLICRTCAPVFCHRRLPMKSKMKNKVIAFAMSLAMVFTMMPMMTGTVHAATEITVNGIKYILNDDNTAAVASFQDTNITGGVTIPSSITADGTSYSVTSIDDLAFDYCTGMTGIDIPSSVTSIGEDAFSRCSSLESIHIPSSVTSIGKYAFARCSSLESIHIPSSVTSIGDGSFYECSSLASIDIPSSVTSIGEHAFSGCSSLASIDIPSSVTSIGEYAFFRCSNLASIDIPSSVTSIGNNAFSVCSSLKNINFLGCEGQWSALTSGVSLGLADSVIIKTADHKWNTEWSTNGDKHWHECTVCHTKKDEEAHNWSSDWSTDGVNHWHECTVCHTKKDEEAHTMSTKWSTDGDNHWHECTACGERKDEAAHTMSTEWSTDGDKHWHECTICGEKKDEVAHTWNTEWSTDRENHWHECSVCGEKKDEVAHTWSIEWSKDGEKHWHECSVCGEKKDEVAHTWSIEWSKDGEKHWHECSACGAKKDEVAHTWKTEWSTDGDKHWHECTVCGKKNGETVHTWVDATCTEAKTCEICDTTEGDPLGHKYGEWTNFNINQHQRVCEHDKSHVEKENHKWDAGKVTKKATEKAEGEKTFTCTICEGTKTESIPKLKPSAPKISGTPLAKATVKKNSMTIGWNKIQGAAGYDIFFALCNHNKKEIKCKKVKTIKGNKTFKWSKSGLKKGTAYKFYVRAYVTKNGKKTYVSKSPMMHAYTGNGTKNYTNAKSVTVNKTKVTLKNGKTFKIKAKVNKVSKKKKLMPKSHAPTIRYMTSNSKIATVNSGGKVTAKGKGTCTVYVFAQNGVAKAIKVTVK